MKALLVVDLQYDFMPGGSLGVPEGDLIAPVILSIRDSFDLVVFTQDWHPANHCSFKENGGIWPVHCVQNSHGAQIDSRVLRPDDIVIQKGTNPDIDSYSGFWDNERKNSTTLNTTLRDRKVDTLYICGIATDYCVQYTALDAIDEGYDVFLVADACRGVNVKPGDVDRAITTMIRNNVTLINSMIVGE